MQVGSLVETIVDFNDVKAKWPYYNYPNKGDILAIKTMHKHHKWGINKKTYKFYLLTFEEMITFPLADINFRELQPPMDLTSIVALQHTKPDKVTLFS